MTLSEVAALLECRCLTGEYDPEREIEGAFASDLMSDVLAYIKNSDTILVTGLVNNQVIRTAEMIEIDTVIFVRGKLPNVETIEMARDHGISLFSTALSSFEAVGLLYGNGIRG